MVGADLPEGLFRSRRGRYRLNLSYGDEREDVKIRGLVAVAVTALMLGTAASASPIKNATYRSSTMTNVLDIVDTAGLCPEFVEARTTTMTVTYRGWYGPTYVDPADQHLKRHVTLTAAVGGRVMDTSGQVYLVEGRFKEAGVQDLFGDFGNGLLFQGDGHVNLKGGGGDSDQIKGSALLKVLGGPSSIWITFTNVERCHIG